VKALLPEKLEGNYLGVAAEMANLGNFDICRLLWNAGLPLLSEPFFTFIRESDHWDFRRFMEDLEVPDQVSELYKELPYHLACRLRNNNGSNFYSLARLWIRGHFPNQPFYEIDRTKREECAKEFYKSVLQVKETCGFQFDDKELREEAGPGAPKEPVVIPRVLAEQEQAFQINDDEMQKIVQLCGFTFEKDVRDLSQARDWGLVLHLLKEQRGNLDPKIGFSVLNNARYGKANEVILALFDAGLPMYYDYSSQDSFEHILMDCDGKILQKILAKVSHTEESKDTFHQVAFYIACRYRDRLLSDPVEQDIVQQLNKLWKEATAQDFLAAILHVIKDRRFDMKDPNFEMKFRDLVK
jgi:hypothetical protein